MKYDVWNLVGEYKRSSDLYQLRKTAWKLPTLIPGFEYKWSSDLYQLRKTAWKLPTLTPMFETSSENTKEVQIFISYAKQLENYPL